MLCVSRFVVQVTCSTEYCVHNQDLEILGRSQREQYSGIYQGLATFAAAAQLLLNTRQGVDGDYSKTGEAGVGK